MIVIVGLGALGSHVALLLRNLKESLKLVDFDRVDAHNIQAQFHGKMGQGINKAAALGRALQGMFGTKVEVVPHKLTLDNNNQILKGATLMLDCTDNFAAREIIKSYSKAHAVPCLHGALSADGTFAQIMWTEHFKADSEDANGKATCIDGEHLPFFAAAAAFMAIEAQNFLVTGKKRSYQLTPSGLIRVA